MAEKCGFFDAHSSFNEEGEIVYDRVYLADAFARYFASFIGNGVFGGKSDELIVRQKETANMSVRLMPGQAWINGYWYANDGELSLSIDIADGVLNRIDIIVLRWDIYKRAIYAVVKKGTPAANAVAPTIQRDADCYELKLAEVYVKAGATNIIQANITDTRLITSVCGLVQGVVKQFDTESFGIQLDSYIKSYAAEYKAWLEQLEIDSVNDINVLKAKLDEILSDNDLYVLNHDVAELKSILTESADFAGCYYREVNGEIEWWNPPKQLGVEYRTIERWQNNPVYQMTLYVASLPDSTLSVIYSNATISKVVSVDGYAVDKMGMKYFQFPVILNNTVVPVADISNVGSDGSIVIYATRDMSNYNAYITIKYTKP